MSNHDDVFVAIYTAHPKRYCDEKFFKRIGEIAHGARIEIIDNSEVNIYKSRLENITRNYLNNYGIEKIHVNKGERFFLRAVSQSLEILRIKFLDSQCKYFIIIESDIYPIADDVLDRFKSVINFGDIIGGIYYSGFHKDEWFNDLNEKISVKMCLSGCTLYKRNLLETVRFRYDLENPDAFPDAHMSHDASRLGYRLINYTGIQCEHLHDKDGGRGHHEVN